MLQLVCPNCGGRGRIPRDKINSRLVCKKCHIVFHHTATGRTILGEPPAELTGGLRQGGGEAVAAAKPKISWQERLPEFTVTGRSAGISLAVVVLFAAAYFFFNRAPESLLDRGRVVGQAFSRGDLSGLKGNATPGTVDEVVQWYGLANRILDSRKKLWGGGEIVVGALVIDENPRQRSGEVLISLLPAAGMSGGESSARTPGAQAKQSLEVTLFFASDPWGKWRLDGKKTNDAAIMLKE